jgi:hypothetical protein
LHSTDIPIKKHRPRGPESLASGNSCMVGSPDTDERPKPGSFPKALKRKALATNAAMTVPIVKPVCHSYGPPRDPPKDLDIDSEMPDAAVVRTNFFLFAFVS